MAMYLSASKQAYSFVEIGQGCGSFAADVDLQLVVIDVR